MKKVDFKQASIRFLTRLDIKLCEDGWNGWKVKSKFYDKIEQDYFWSIPKNVYMQKSCHPNRARKNRIKTNVEKYGNPCSLHGEKIKEKTKKTLQEKYGKNVKNALQSKEAKEKIRNILKEKYGVSNPSQSDEVKNKKRETCLKNYGVEVPAQSDVVKEKMRETCKKKYGAEHVMTLNEFKEKNKQTMKERHGVESPFQLPGVKEKSKSTILKTYGTETFWESKNVKMEDPQKSLFDWKNDKKLLEEHVENILNIKIFHENPDNLKEDYKPDFKLSDSVYLNVDGLYWNSETVQEDRRYHFNMRKYFEENGLRIIQIREDEIKKKSDVCKSIINNAIGKTPRKIFARKCKINIVPHKIAKEFYANNHMMGATTAKHIGLYYFDELVSLISYKEKKHICKIERFCSVINANIVGGFSKLLTYLEKECLKESTTEIHNWVDLRYGTGNHLISKGFVKRSRDELGWKWTDYTNTFNRLKCKANMDERKLTQQEHADELGWHKIYDAGQRVYIKYLNSSS